MGQAASVILRGDEIDIRTEGALGVPDLERLVARLFSDAGTRSLSIRPDGRRFRVRSEGGREAARSLMLRMADVLVRDGVAEASLPRLNFRDPGVATTLTRWSGIVTFLPLRDLGNHLIDLKVPAGANRQDLTKAISGLPGVIEVESRRLSRRIKVRFDPRIDPRVWIRALENALVPPVILEICEAPRVPFLTANTNLALCTTGQFLFPPAIPWVSGVLVLTRIPHLRHAARELREGKIGAPFFGSVVLTCSVAAMAPFASALAEWLGCLWERRWRKGIALESARLIRDIAPLSGNPASSAGAVSLGSGAVTPFDGILTSGELLVQDGLGDPLSTPVLRRRSGDLLDAGYRVLGGSARFVPQGNPPSSRIDQILSSISALPASLPTDPVIRLEARKIADRAVYPNLALAGLAYYSGGLHMASAILHQDWSTGPFIAAPTEFFADVRAGLRAGVLVHTPGALKKLAAIDVLVVDLADPALTETRPRIFDIEASGKTSLRVHGWAELLAGWIGDARASAFRDLARISESTAREARFLGFDTGVLALEIDGLRVELVDLEPGNPYSPIRLSIENETPEILLFEPSDRLRHQRTFERLKALGIATVLVGGRGASEEAHRLGQGLGADSVHPGLEGAGLKALIDSIESGGYQTAFLGLREFPEAELAEHRLVIAPSSELKNPEDALTRLGSSLARLPDMVLAARTLPARVGLATLRTVPTNLLCILGAFAGTVNGTTATVLAHIGVMGVSVAQGRKIRKSRRHPLIRDAR